MSYVEKAIDRVPFIPYAGSYQSMKSKDNNIDMNLRPDLYFSPETTTPDKIKKYRDSLRQRVGVKQLHPGIYDDPRDYENLRHGKTTKSSDHVPDVIKGLNLNGNNSFMNELAESRYASNKREPLGKSIVRNYKFPEVVKSADFKFGVPTTGILNAKNLIYYGSKEEPEDVKNLYYKSHGTTDPGKQNTRYYKWNFDPNKHTFGYSPKIEIDGAKNSLMTDTLNNPYPQTKLLSKRVEDFRAFNNPLLGKGKFYGSLNPKFYDENHVFGKESKLRPTQNNLDRIYGVPSIRRDLPKRIVKSVTDIKNYGDEPDAYDLLYPHPEAIRGVHDEDFEKLLSKEEIYSQMKKYDFIIPEKEYDLMFEVALKNYPNDEGKISPKSFISTMRNLKREYQKYRVLEIK